MGLGSVLAFWTVYVLTRPLGSSAGDCLSRPTGDGGRGLGTVVAGAPFLAVFLGLVVFLTASRRDGTDADADRVSRPAV